MASGLRHGRHEDVGIVEGQGDGDLILVLEEQPVLLASGNPMELDPDAGEEGGGGLEGGQVGVVGQQRRIGRNGA